MKNAIAKPVSTATGNASALIGASRQKTLVKPSIAHELKSTSPAF